ncbi:MAG: acetylxylan esterase [Opitutaceae bacterium]|jgi:hypothetical protein|nr:acetylxylan esterase [Opitutaceae bacterium]
MYFIFPAIPQVRGKVVSWRSVSNTTTPMFSRLPAPGLFPTLVIIMLAIIDPVHSQDSQEDLSVFSYWNDYSEQTDFLYRQLSRRAYARLEQRKASLARLETLDDWQRRQSRIRDALRSTLGEFPSARPPLNPVITGTLVHEGVTIEKLHFESLPGYHVTAALFLPPPRSRLSPSGKLPAIVYCSGHAVEGFRFPAYQRNILNYARKGFAVLAFDPVGQGERIQYFNTDGSSRFGPTHEHSYPGVQSFIAGRPPAWYFVWDGIRAIDYLVSRPGIDAARIGITGRSGGGTQSAWIAAVDPRIAAAAPECYITSLEKLLRSRGLQDAEQNLLRGIASGLDIGDFLIARAPRPTLVVSTTNDFFSIQGARDVFAEARGAWRAWGREGNLRMVEDDAPHASTRKNREAVCAFFQEHLANPGSPDDEPVGSLEPEKLHVTSTGSVYADGGLGGETLFSLSRSHAQAGLRARRGASGGVPAAAFASASALRERVVALTGYEAPPDVAPVSVFSGRIRRPSYSVEKYMVPGPGGYPLPFLRLAPAAPAAPAAPGAPGGRAFLVLDDRGKAAAVQPGEIADLLARLGHEVIVADLGGCGELANGRIARQGDACIGGVSFNLWFLGLQTGKSLLAVHIEEIRVLEGVVNAGRAAPVVAVARGVHSGALLHAVFLGARFSEIVLIEPLASMESLVNEREYHPGFVPSVAAGAVLEYDVPDILAALPDQKILLVNPVDARARTLSPEAANAFLRGGRARANEPDGNLRIVVSTSSAGALVDLLEPMEP